MFGRERGGGRGRWGWRDSDTTVRSPVRDRYGAQQGRSHPRDFIANIYALIGTHTNTSNAWRDKNRTNETENIISKECDFKITSN